MCGWQVKLCDPLVTRESYLSALRCCIMIKHLLTSVVLLHDTTHVHGLDEPSMFECVCTSVCESVCVCVCLCVCRRTRASSTSTSVVTASQSSHFLHQLPSSPSSEGWSLTVTTSYSVLQLDNFLPRDESRGDLNVVVSILYN